MVLRILRIARESKHLSLNQPLGIVPLLYTLFMHRYIHGVLLIGQCGNCKIKVEKHSLLLSSKFTPSVNLNLQTSFLLKLLVCS